MTLQNAFTTFLQSEEANGFTDIRQISADLTIFSYSGIHFLYSYQADDPNVFRLIIPKVELYREELIHRMLDFTKRYKVAKVIELDDTIWFSYEQLVFNQKEGDYRLFKIAIKILTAMFREWKENPSPATDSTVETVDNR